MMSTEMFLNALDHGTAIRRMKGSASSTFRSSRHEPCRRSAVCRRSEHCGRSNADHSSVLLILTAPVRRPIHHRCEFVGNFYRRVRCLCKIINYQEALNRRGAPCSPHQRCGIPTRRPQCSPQVFAQPLASCFHNRAECLRGIVRDVHCASDVLHTRRSLFAMPSSC